MKGKNVIVRSYGGYPLIRKIWKESGDIIFITNDEQFDLLINKDTSAIQPIGFPLNDVFKHSRELEKNMDKLIMHGLWDWSKLSPYKSI